MFSGADIPQSFPRAFVAMPGPPPFDADLLDRLPGVLAIPLKAFAAEDRPELRLHRLCDCADARGHRGNAITLDFYRGLAVQKALSTRGQRILDDRTAAGVRG
jgi:hypothetical protein